MRPAKAAPDVPSAKLPLRQSPNACASDHRGISDPVVPFKPPCLTQLKLKSGPIVACTGPQFLSRLLISGAAGRLGLSPAVCEPRPLGSHATGPTKAAGTAHESGNQKSRVRNPQSATPISIIDHSEGFSPNSLPSLTTYVIIASTLGIACTLGAYVSHFSGCRQRGL
jgi:hypothetical protein